MDEWINCEIHHQAFRKASLKNTLGAAGQAPSGPAALTFQEAVLWARRFREKMFTSYSASSAEVDGFDSDVRPPTTRGRQEMTKNKK